MANETTVTIIGTLVGDPELRYTPVLVDQATQNRSTGDEFLAEVRDGVGRVRFTRGQRGGISRGCPESAGNDMRRSDSATGTAG